MRDPELATACTRAYNRWIVYFCSEDRRRLVPIAHITLLDPEGAVEELRRARQAGCAGVYLSPDPAARWGRMFDDPAFARFFATVQDLDMPIAFHVVGREDSPSAPWSFTRDGVGDRVFAFAFLAIDVMAAFTSMMTPVQLLDLAMLAGLYGLASRVAPAMGVEVDGGLDPDRRLLTSRPRAV